MNALGGSLKPSVETLNRGHNTPIPKTHVLICEEFKDDGVSPKDCVQRVSVIEQLTSMHENQTHKSDVPEVNRL